MALESRARGDGWRTVTTTATARRKALVLLTGEEVGRWRYRLSARYRGRTVVTPARNVDVVSRQEGSDWSETKYAVGDIGECGGPVAATAGLIPLGAGLLALGDIAYPKGRLKDFARCYLPHYGRLLDTTKPVPGNHEYFSGGAGYFATFGNAAGTRGKPWYAWESGPWRFLMLDSNCGFVGGCGKESRQFAWVKRQLRDNPRQCVAAAWHHPVTSSGSRHGNDPAMKRPLRLLVRAGADLILNGHEHSYERFARLGVAGRPSPSGARAFVVGTGGANLYEFADPRQGSEVRYNGSHGVLRLELEPDSYEWEFLAVDGTSVDSGSDTCN